MIKMVVTDIDGTILSGELGYFTPAVKECIKKLTNSEEYSLIDFVL